MIFDKKEIHPSVLLAHLSNNFANNPMLQRRLLALPKYGNGNSEVDEIAKDISAYIYNKFLNYAPWRGGRFLASCIMFVTYGQFGKSIGATPDGRGKDTPVADSAGAVQGRDRNGPTSLLRSVTMLDNIHAPGTLVVNIRFTKKMFSNEESKEKIKALIKTYFKMGGMQLQVNVVDQELLKDALAHPENYEDLVIRMGGYSEYFNRLGDELKLSILERTAHET